MSTAPLAHTDVIVLDYLAALWAQSEDLSPQQRDELMTTVADYIAARRAAASSPLEDATAIVQRLGPPEALVSAVRRGQLPPHVRLPALFAPPLPPLPAQQAGVAEYTAVGMLTAGAFFLPVVSPVAGMLLASASPHFTPADKAVGWTLTAGSAALGAVLTLFFATLPFHTGAALLLIYLAMCTGAFAAGMSLLNSLRRRGQGR
ncbi:HAAS signaling domain-containing protein [Actinoplanes sp. NPDC051513]|uniref:HAAS signaling domain-containing protein n=1 Tax=Actinoplanes sp. NPDC051513 TaxID=3363908 RepID=UPI0037AC8CD4